MARRRAWRPVFVAIVILVGASLRAGADDRTTVLTYPPRSISVSESEVLDVFFAYIVGILVEDLPLRINGSELLEMFPEFEDGSGQVPFHKIEVVVREPRPGARGAVITVTFSEDIEYPVPVDILGYHPGTIQFSRQLRLLESAVSPDSPDFQFVREVRVVSGRVAIDFDQWLDTLLGRWVDDVNARVLVALRYQDHWYALLGGDTPHGGWITGVYDLESSRIIVRPDSALRELGHMLGSTAE